MSISSIRHDIKVNTAIAALLGNLDEADDDQLTRAVNSKIMLAHFAGNEANSHRLDAGRMLIELHKRKAVEGVDWWPWVKENIQCRSRRDVQRLMKIARADDPIAAAQTERARNRNHKAAQRARPATDCQSRGNVVSFPRNQRVNRIFRLIEALSDQEQRKLRELCRERLSWE
jgi:hypothetical protein